MSDKKREPVVIDVKTPFPSMAALVIERAVAAIPALIVLPVIGSAASTARAAISCGGMPHRETGPSWMS